ncbi:MAG: hypothetical protein HFJ37_04635 [Clostridia bacterium]|nr:hypothetical protein [Clostridia bacterium]
MNMRYLTEKNLKELIQKEPKKIENYITLSELYQKEKQDIKKVLEPIEYVEKQILKTQYDEDICIRKIDIYSSFGDIALEQEEDKKALKYYLIAWKFVKNYIRKVKIKEIQEYNMATIGQYSLYDLIYNIDFAYDELGEKYARQRRNFIQEVMKRLHLYPEEAKPFLQGLKETQEILRKQRAKTNYNLIRKKSHRKIKETKKKGGKC